MSNTKNSKNNSKLIILVIGIIAIILIAVLIFTKGKDEKNKVAQPGNEAKEAEVTMNTEFSSSFLTMDKAAIADTKDDVIAALGDPEKEEEFEDKIPGVKAINLIYDGGETKVTVRNGRVEQITSTNKDRTFTRGIKIGISQKELEGILPASSKIENSRVPEDSVVYSEVNSDEYQYAKYARFVIKGGKVSEVILSIGD